MKLTLLMLTMVASALAGDYSAEIRDLTAAVDANTTAINMQGSHSSGGWMYELMFGRENRRQEARRQEIHAIWQAKRDETLAKQQAKQSEDERNDRQDRAMRAYLQSPPDEGHYNHPNSPGPEIRRAIPVAK
jgi:hypothetical protein